MGEEKYLLTSVSKALEVLDLLGDKSDLGITEIAAKLGLGKTTVFRLLYTLESCGFVQKGPEHKYRLSIKFAYYGARVAENKDLVQACRPLMQRLSVQYGCNAHLGTIIADGIYVCIYKEFGNSPLQIGSYVGHRVEAYLCGSGKVLLAYQSPEQQRQFLDAYDYHKATPYSIADRAELEKELDIITRQGFGFDNEEYEEGLFCVAAPIFNWQNQCIAAMSLSGSKDRIVRSKYAIAGSVCAAAREVSRELGCAL